MFHVIVSRDFPLDKLKDRLTVKLTRSGKVYIIFLVDGYYFEPLPMTGKKAGINVGIEKLLTISAWITLGRTCT